MFEFPEGETAKVLLEIGDLTTFSVYKSSAN